MSSGEASLEGSGALGAAVKKEDDMSAAVSQATRVNHHSMIRALSVAGGVAAAVIGWAIEVPVLGVRLSVHFGAMRSETVIAPQVAGAALVAGLAGWLLLTAIERRTARARVAWTGIALLALVLSLALPLATATTTAAAVALIVLHLAVGAVVIPPMAASARQPRR